MPGVPAHELLHLSTHARLKHVLRTPRGGAATGSATLRFRHADGCDVEVPTSRSVLAGASADTTQVVFVRADAPAAAALQDGDRRSTSGTSPSWTCGPGPSSAWRPWLDGCTRSLDNSARVRPADLVGAITGEAGLRGRDVGAIGITQRSSLVEVPVPAADGVVRALRSATIKGRQPVVRRDRGRTG